MQYSGAINIEGFFHIKAQIAQQSEKNPSAN